MKRILLAFLLMLPVMSAVNVAYDPMPAPCLPCTKPKPDNDNGSNSGSRAAQLLSWLRS